MNKENPSDKSTSVQEVDCCELLAKRNQKASEIVREKVKEREEESMTIYKTWRYVDFVDEDRFLDEVGDDKRIKDKWDAEQVAEYALDQIYS
mgnify:CR=1 FL=1|tara:strand:- start:1029 stop:1304 length:276 start_codon:yes stop_codon:yes gene_type:complete